jgi:hypothetical protein
MVLTTQAVITEIPKKKTKAAGGAAAPDPEAFSL